MRSKAYLAGPDVFDPDHDRIFKEHSRLCQKFGIEPLIPLDNRLKTAEDIFTLNLSLLDQADIVIANLSPFRGPHCDVGTAWEVAYAYAHQRPVFAYSTDPRPLNKRILADLKTGRDPEGLIIESFGLFENLMIAEAVVGRKAFISFEEAITAAASHKVVVGRHRSKAIS